jgi:hypothetical protein
VRASANALRLPGLLRPCQLYATLLDCRLLLLLLLQVQRAPHRRLLPLHAA